VKILNYRNEIIILEKDTQEHIQEFHPEITTEIIKKLYRLLMKYGKVFQIHAASYTTFSSVKKDTIVLWSKFVLMVILFRPHSPHLV